MDEACFVLVLMELWNVRWHGECEDLILAHWSGMIVAGECDHEEEEGEAQDHETETYGVAAVFEETFLWRIRKCVMME